MEAADLGDGRSLSGAEAAEIWRLANILYFRSRAYRHTRWMGHRSMKCPMDMWVYQELIVAGGIDLVIETGTLEGGSALFFAQLFDRIGNGRVVTVDIEARAGRPEHPRIDYLTGSSITRAVLDRVAERAAAATRTMVILDSEHRAPYKLLELHTYAPFVSPGCHLVAEDSAFDHYPAFPEFGPGPAEAVAAFLKTQPQFAVDGAPERHGISFAPKAFLKRVGSG